jgi:hypothetical protein
MAKACVARIDNSHYPHIIHVIYDNNFYPIILVATQNRCGCMKLEYSLAVQTRRTLVLCLITHVAVDS